MSKVGLKRSVTIITTILFYVIIFSLIIFSISSISLKKDDDIANIFGRGYVSVLTDSMAGDKKDSFSSNDLILVKVLDDESREKLREGDIVTFYRLKISTLPGTPSGFITHRIIRIFQLGDETFIQTQGDAPGALPDNPIHISEALSVYTGQIKGVGSVIKTLQTPNGFALFVIIPVAILLIVQIVLLTRNVFSISNQKNQEKLELEKQEALKALEVEKEKIRQQLLEEIKSQNNQ